MKRRIIVGTWALLLFLGAQAQKSLYTGQLPAQPNTSVIVDSFDFRPPVPYALVGQNGSGDSIPRKVYVWQFNLTPFAGTPLPMKWVHAEADYVKNHNEIKWITADEWGCKNYIVEKSNNGHDWQPVAEAIPAGNIAGPNNYHFTDPSSPASVTWYRIRQTDIDGRISYSVTLITQTGRGIILQLYPNPASQQFTISAGQSLREVQVYNAAGSIVYTKKIDASTYHTVNSSLFPAGNYYAVIQLGDGNVVKEYFVKQ
jgi:hypothetical protein